MRERSDWFYILLMAAGAGAAAGYHYFLPLMKFVCVGVFPTFVGVHAGAAKLARWSFTVGAGLALACVPLATLCAQRFAKRSRYDRAVGKALLMGVVGFFAAMIYYRYEMTAFGSSTSELYLLLTDSKKHLIFNPLTKIALLSGGCSLGYGVLKGMIDYSPSGR